MSNYITDLGATRPGSRRIVRGKTPGATSFKRAPVTLKKTLVLGSRRKRGAPRKPFVPGRAGRPLRAPAKRAVVTVKTPTLQRSEAIIERPRSVVEAGVMPGEPPPTVKPVPVTPARHSAVHTAPGPSLKRAVAARNVALDRIAEQNIDEAQVQVPQITPAKPSKALVYGGVGVAALVGIYLLTRKK